MIKRHYRGLTSCLGNQESPTKVPAFRNIRDHFCTSRPRSPGQRDHLLERNISQTGVLVH